MKRLKLWLSLHRRLIISVLSLFLLLGLFYDTSYAPAQEYKKMILGNKTYRLEVVETEAAQQKGLSGRTGLPKDRCMLFVFSRPGPYGFWMKDMHFSLDIMWLSAAKEVIYVQKDVSPSTYPTNYVPPSPSLYTLECNAGFADQNHLAIGQQLSF